jgi:hypothetical protein
MEIVVGLAVEAVVALRAETHLAELQLLVKERTDQVA